MTMNIPAPKFASHAEALAWLTGIIDTQIARAIAADVERLQDTGMAAEQVARVEAERRAELAAWRKQALEQASRILRDPFAPSHAEH